MRTKTFGPLAIAVALFACSVTAEPSYAQKQTKRSAASIQAECAKSHGAAYDATKKKWVLHIWQESGLVNRLDAVRDCIARRQGTPRGAIAIPEVPID